MGRHYLFTTWDGSGNVPPELSLARGLIARGHQVTLLGDPTLRPDAEAAGTGFIPWREAPHIVSRRPEDDPYRDYETKSPPKLVARLSERLMCTPARHHAAETAAAAREAGADIVVSDAMLLGSQMGAEAEGLPFFAVFSNVYPLPAPGLPPFGTGWRPAAGTAGRARSESVARVVRSF